MSSTEFPAKTKALKAALTKAIQETLNDFHRETGVTPSNIRIRMVDVSTADQKEYQLATIDVEFTL